MAIVTRRLIHPEPGVSFSYQEWKTGRNVTRAVVPPSSPSAVHGRNGGPEVQTNHEYYSISFQDEFRHRGLQVVARIDSIELIPDKLRFQDCDDEDDEIPIFHAADTMATDYIAATSIVFFDVENVKPMHVRFQQPAELYDHGLYEGEHADYLGIFEVFDLDYCDPDQPDQIRFNPCQNNTFSRVQELGRVVAREGRMLSFPGPVMYHFEPCSLLDASKPGHARYLVLYLSTQTFVSARQGTFPRSA